MTQRAGGLCCAGEGILGSDPSGWAQNYFWGALGEEGDRRSLEQCVCKWRDPGMLWESRAGEGTVWWAHIPLEGEQSMGCRDASSSSASPGLGADGERGTAHGGLLQTSRSGCRDLPLPLGRQ